MRRFFSGLLVAAIMLIGSTAAQAAVTLYEQNFDGGDDTANWTVNDSGLSDITVDFNYDYSAIGVPNAPGSGSRGLKMTANNAGGVFSGFSVSPTGQNFTGSYKVSFNLWQNYVGPLGPGGSGTTQLSTFGVGTSGTTAFWAGSAKESVGFAATLDGGSAVDYRAYSSAAGTGYTVAGNPGVFSAPSQNNSDGYYAGFGGATAPAAQLGLFPGQTGATDPGEISFAWRAVTIDVDSVAGSATWSVDGLQIARVDLAGLTLGGGNIFFGQSDTNNGSSADPNRSLLNVTLIDNIRVTAVPEPSALGLGLVGVALSFVRRRRRR